jgi:hypothetical protein
MRGHRSRWFQIQIKKKKNIVLMRKKEPLKPFMICLLNGEALFVFFTFDTHRFQIGLTFNWNSSASLALDIVLPGPSSAAHCSVSHSFDST